MKPGEFPWMQSQIETRASAFGWCKNCIQIAADSHSTCTTAITRSERPTMGCPGSSQVSRNHRVVRPITKVAGIAPIGLMLQ